jgi:hypothetical protein
MKNRNRKAQLQNQRRRAASMAFKLRDAKHKQAMQLRKAKERELARNKGQQVIANLRAQGWHGLQPGYWR